MTAKQSQGGQAPDGSLYVTLTDGAGALGGTIGTVSIGSNQTVDLNKVAGASVATGHGTASGAIRVELPTDGTGVVVPSNTSTTPLFVEYARPTTNPFTRATINITSATTTTIVSLTAAQTVKVYRMFLNFDAAQTVDIQDTDGTSLVGGALSFGANTGVVWGLEGELHFVTASGKGLQFVTTTTGKVRGYIDYIKS